MSTPTVVRTTQRIAWIEPSRMPYGVDDQNIYTGVLFPRGGPKMAAVLGQLGYEVEVISGELSAIDHEAIARDFDLACISVLSNTAPHGLVLGRWLTELGLPVVMGGYQFAHRDTTEACMAPTDQALDFVPYVIRGEGYTALPAFLEALEGKRPLSAVRGLSYRDAAGRTIHNETAELLSREAINELPPANWRAVRDRDRMVVAAVHGMQGCPRSCSWCAVWPRDGRTDRNSTPDHFVDELQAVLASSDFLSVFFSADNFPAFPRWATEVCQEINRRGIDINWSCQAEVGAIRHTEMVDAMIAAGCERWCLGLETINPASLSDSNKRQSRETMEACIKELHRRGLQVHGMFIVGLPHDTPESVRATVAWAKRMKIETVQFLCLIDLPGSADYEQFNLAENSFRPLKGAYEPLNWLFVNGHYARLGNETMTVSDVQTAAENAMLSFYTVPRALAPLLQFNAANYRTNRIRGHSRWRSLRSALLHHMFVAGLRFRGVINISRWKSNPLNKAYRRLVKAEDWQTEPLIEQMLFALPATWLRTFEQVYRERQARLERLASEQIAAG
ncbi:MAG: radical SAM protein [Armatimonadetes bacterium]|nr:radical SAM protein [Armatimonadota bacterium]